jgi:hypothetical protein
LTKLQEVAKRKLDEIDDVRRLKRSKKPDGEKQAEFKLLYPESNYAEINKIITDRKDMIPLYKKIVKDVFRVIPHPLADIQDIKMPTKMLINFLRTYQIPTFGSIQCVFDFEPSVISYDLMHGSEKEKTKFLDSIRKIEINTARGEREISNFRIKNDNTRLESNPDPDETVEVRLTKPSPKVVFSKFLTDGARDFEEYYKAEYKKNKDDFLAKTLNDKDIPSIPLFFISAAQSRKKNKKFDKYYENWKLFADNKTQDIKDDGNLGDSIKLPPDTTKDFTTQKQWVDWAALNDTNIIPNRVKFLMSDDKFSFTSFHVNIVFYFEGLIYSLGYGLDQNSEAHKNTYLASLEEAIKKTETGKMFVGTELFGQGVLFSPDSVDTNIDTYNFNILDIGILDTEMINKINAIFSKIKAVNSMMYVTKEESTTNLQYHSFYAPLTYIYSRLSTNKLPQLQGSKFFNCSSFAENISSGRLDCGLLYSDPNKCKALSTPLMNTQPPNKIQEFLKTFFMQTCTMAQIKNELNYNPFSFSETLMMSAPFQGFWGAPP